MRNLLISALSLLASSAFAAEWKVATLHPLLADLAREVGGERVEVIDLIGVNGDPHHFEPAPADLKRAADAKLYLLSGMGLESYLDGLRSTVGNKAEILEVSKGFPTLEGACNHDHDDHDHDHHHDHGIDPHWWHSIDLFRRATTTTADAFCRLDPAGTETYRRNAETYRGRLDALERWTRVQIARIPKDRRYLATAHAAFAYFCKDYGFTSFSVQGVNREQMPNPKQLSELIAELKEEKVIAIFPEKESNPKILQALTRDTGIQLGKPLIADGSTAASYEAMVRHNVSTIVEGLTSQPAP